MNDLDLLLSPEGRALLDEVRDTDPARELAVALTGAVMKGPSSCWSQGW
ncbi:hypothetical protein [Streptomyces tendae]